ncbi:MAG: hypothetical protein JJU36_04350 [Phycisphaeraceae bacterium]|nr:hypothetical protein [Phycisphaeraceae bacterium]
MRHGCVFVAAGAALLTSWSALQAATIQWLPDADGDWSVASNWSSDPALPGAADDVVVDVGGAMVRTVTLDINATINSLQSQESLLFSEARVLTLADGGQIGPAASLTMDVNARLNINGGSFAILGAANIDGANVYVSNATANLGTVTGYITDTGTNNNRTLQASGAGALLNLDGMTSMAGGGFIRTLFVNALAGATVDLSSLADHSVGATRFRADGSGSMIDLGSLDSFHNSNGNGIGRLHVANGGAINISSLTSVSASVDNRMEIIVDGAASVLDTSGIGTMTNTLVQLLNGGAADLSAVTTFGGSSLDIRAGAVVQMPGLTGYTPNTGGNGNRTWRAREGSRIEAANLLTAEGGTFIRNWTIDAQSGGVIDLSSLASITTGDTRVRADGAGSLVDLSSLTSWLGSGSTLAAINGGEVRLPTASDVSINMQGVAISHDGSGVLDLSGVASLVSGSLSASGVAVDTPNLAAIGDSSLSATAGGVINLPGLETTGYLHGGGNVERRFVAEGEGSRLDLAAMTAIMINAGTIPSMRIDALQGGQLDLSGVESIDATPGIINGSRPVRILAEGDDSLIDLAALESFTDLASVTNSSITARDGGIVRLHATELTRLTNLTVTIGEGSRLEGAGIELLGVFTPTSTQTAADRIDDARLIGSGIVVGDVVNTSGFVLPGSSAGELEIQGQYIQDELGVLVIELGGLVAGVEHDRLRIAGSAQLGGMLDVELIGGFELDLDQRFEILMAEGGLTGTFIDLPNHAVVGSFGGLDLRIEYHPDIGRVELYSIPEPASLILLSLGCLALVGRGRR